jgi:hypothetical protein
VIRGGARNDERGCVVSQRWSVRLSSTCRCRCCCCSLGMPRMIFRCHATDRGEKRFFPQVGTCDRCSACLTSVGTLLPSSVW